MPLSGMFWKMPALVPGCGRSFLGKGREKLLEGSRRGGSVNPLAEWKNLLRSAGNRREEEFLYIIKKILANTAEKI